MKTNKEIGPIDAQEVMRYQRVRGLEIDGVVGNQTWGQLMLDLKTANGLKQRKYWMIACALLAITLAIVLAL